MSKPQPTERHFASWVDAQIEAAEARGEFENLPGKGKPIAGLDQPHDEMWWVKQLMVRENLSYLPPALAIRRDAEILLDRLAAFASESAVRAAVAALNVDIREINRKPGLDGPPSTLMPLDEDEVVDRWRAARPEPATTTSPEIATTSTHSSAAKSRWWRGR